MVKRLKRRDVPLLGITREEVEETIRRFEQQAPTAEDVARLRQVAEALAAVRGMSDGEMRALIASARRARQKP